MSLRDLFKKDAPPEPREEPPELTNAEKLADKKRAYWANKGKPPERPSAGGTLVCGKCMDWAMTQKDPRARALAIRTAARGPWERLPMRTPDGQTAYRHVGCPWRDQ